MNWPAFVYFYEAKGFKMRLKGIDLRQELEKFRNQRIAEEDLLEQVYAVLEVEQEKESRILERLHQGSSGNENSLDPDLLENTRIFHRSHIKAICIRYRLRFLDTRYFKADLPEEALLEIKRLEKLHGTTLQGFKIIAPSKHFKLENADDPILMAPLGNDYYYLVHKWGHDLHPLRKFLMWPMRNVENLVIFTFFFSFLLTFGIRELFFSRYQETSEFIMLYMFTFKAMVGIIVFYGIALGKNFSSAIWKSKYYNA